MHARWSVGLMWKISCLKWPGHLPLSSSNQPYFMYIRSGLVIHVDDFQSQSLSVSVFLCPVNMFTSILTFFLQAIHVNDFLNHSLLVALVCSCAQYTQYFSSSNTRTWYSEPITVSVCTRIYWHIFLQEIHVDDFKNQLLFVLLVFSMCVSIYLSSSNTSRWFSEPTTICSSGLFLYSV